MALDSAPRTTRLMLIASVLLTLVGLGCGQSRFEFVVTDEEGRPLEGVLVYYEQADGTPDTVGRTNAEGSLLVAGEHLATPRSYRFLAGGQAGSGRRVFDPSRCALVSLPGGGEYTFRTRDGLVRSPDLDRKLPGKGWPGRQITLQLADAGDSPLAAGTGEVRQLLQRTLDLSGPPEADVEINGRFVGRIPHNGRLLREFCPGDSGACYGPSLQVAVRKAGWTPFERELPLPPPGETVFVDAEMNALADATAGSAGAGAGEGSGTGAPVGGEAPGGSGATGGGDSPAGGEVSGGGAPPGGGEVGPGDGSAGLAWVRFENHGYPLTCGPEGTAWPRVLINDQGHSITASAASTQWKAYYDVLLRPGASYCVAVHCPGEVASAESWNPWDSETGRAAWYRIRISTGETRVFFAIPRYEEAAGLTLRPQSGGSWEGFRAARAPRITSACTR